VEAGHRLRIARDNHYAGWLSGQVDQAGKDCFVPSVPIAVISEQYGETWTAAAIAQCLGKGLP
jgi:hypothetical protein